MLAPLILPLQITCIVVLFLMLMVFAVLRRRMKACAASLSIFTGALLFIPTLIVVGSFTDAARYGKLEFVRGSEIKDRYVEIPASATNVILHKFASGHALRFQADEATLLEWMDAVTQKRREFTKATPFERDELPGNAPYFDHLFGRYGWTAPEDLVLYKGWRSGRGGGFDVWYSPESQTAFISAAYW